MKTPREILLAQHRTAGSKLDAIRRSVVANELQRRVTNQSGSGHGFASLFFGGANTLWRELIFPSRRIWAGLTAVWLVIVTANISQHDDSAANAKPMSEQEVLMTFNARQRLMGELLRESNAPLDAERPKTSSPKPRTELLTNLSA
jgi:hypothetical protein